MNEPMLGFVTRNRCPACASPDFQISVDRPFSDPDIAAFITRHFDDGVPQYLLGEARYQVRRCAGCEGHYQFNILDDESSSRLYEEYIPHEPSLSKRETAGPRYFDRLITDARRVYSFVGDGRPCRQIKVLDFGMGWGHWAFAAFACGYDVAGAELSPSRVAFAAERGIKAIDLDATPASSFDFINTDQVLEHVSDPRGMVGMLARLLKPGGVLKIFVPDTHGTAHKMRAGYAPERDEIHPLEHITAFSRAGMDDMTKAAGLKRERARLPGGPRERLVAMRAEWRKQPSGYFRKA